MYAGAGLALAGAALLLRIASRSSWYGAVLGVITHLFVILYEERVLADEIRTEGPTRIAGEVRRWLPRV